nr:Uncharacterised protein [Klebsiella pneumoniae]
MALKQNGEEVLSGPAMSVTPMVCPFRLSRPPNGESLAVSRFRQPPWVPAVSLTSKPCSSAFSQRSAIPTPASALPVAIASSSTSVELPKLTNSTSRLYLLNIFCCSATATGARHTALC